VPGVFITHRRKLAEAARADKVLADKEENGREVVLTPSRDAMKLSCRAWSGPHLKLSKPAVAEGGAKARDRQRAEGGREPAARDAPAPARRDRKKRAG
jgi:hypothetical protein